METRQQQQLLQIEPSHELLFKGPFTDVVTATLSLSNPTERTVCYKVKTTAPKQYCVRPNSGTIGAGRRAEIHVMLQPAGGGGADTMDPTRHKFMVQSCVAPSDDVDLEALWKSVAPDALYFTKLRVAFVNATCSAVAPPATLSSATSSSQAEHIASEQTGGGGERTQQLESELAKTRRELQDVLANYTRLEMQRQDQTAAAAAGMAPLQVRAVCRKSRIVQVVLVCFVGLLLGLIFGKLL